MWDVKIMCEVTVKGLNLFATNVPICQSVTGFRDGTRPVLSRLQECGTGLIKF